MNLCRLAAATLGLALVSAPPAAARARTARTAAPTSITVSAESGFTIPVQVRGRTFRLRVDPGTSRIVLNPATAAAVRLNGSLFGARAQVGPVRVNGKTSLTRVGIGAWQVHRRVLWFDRDAVAGADGIIGMSMMPYDNITLRMRDPQPGERAIAIPVVADAQYGLLYRHSVGGETVKVHFRFWQPSSQATASAGAHLAVHHGGSWAGESVERPLLLGVIRPVRPMRFATPLSFSGLRMDSILVRTADFRGGYVLPADQPAAAPGAPPADPDEIVVTGNVRRGRAQLVVLIGGDVSSRCSSISYARRAGTLTLNCPAEMSAPTNG